MYISFLCKGCIRLFDLLVVWYSYGNMHSRSMRSLAFGIETNGSLNVDYAFYVLNSIHSVCPSL